MPYHWQVCGIAPLFINFTIDRQSVREAVKLSTVNLSDAVYIDDKPVCSDNTAVVKDEPMDIPVHVDLASTNRQRILEQSGNMSNSLYAYYSVFV